MCCLLSVLFGRGTLLRKIHSVTYTSGGAGLRYLSLRQNLLPDGNMLSRAEFKGTLQELYINDNHLKTVPELTDFTMLKRLEFSYNHEVRRLRVAE